MIGLRSYLLCGYVVESYFDKTEIEIETRKSDRSVDGGGENGPCNTTYRHLKTFTVNTLSVRYH